ncbi:hypothetical protein RCL1_004042 [Eukaryota sp. TZLM3-RCL]
MHTSTLSNALDDNSVTLKTSSQGRVLGVTVSMLHHFVTMNQTVLKETLYSSDSSPVTFLVCGTITRVDSQQIMISEKGSSETVRLDIRSVSCPPLTPGMLIFAPIRLSNKKLFVLHIDTNPSSTTIEAVHLSAKEFAKILYR